MRNIIIALVFIAVGVATTSCEGVRLAGDWDKAYEVGDICRHNGKRGIVFEVSSDGKSGKILGLEEFYGTWYEAVAWSEDRGKGWTLPTPEELCVIYENRNTINKTLKRVVGVEEVTSYWYWSSGAYDDIYAYRIYMYNGDIEYGGKNSHCNARLVAEF